MACNLDERCPFCGRIDEGDYDTVRSASVVRFEPLDPVTPGHMLFVPVGHVEHGDSTATLQVSMAMTAAERWSEGRDEDFNLITSSGASATQTIAHIHVHYVPRRPGDGLPLPWSTQKTERAI